MVFSSRVKSKAATEEIEQFGDDGTDSCPLLGEEENLSSEAQPHRIRDVRRIDNGILSPKRSLVQRILSRKNRFVQRLLVACRLADPSKDLMFKQEQTSNNLAIERLTAIRSSLLAHSQSIVSLSTAICCFTGNSARLHDDSQEALVNVAVEGYRIHECSLVFSDQVEESVLTKIDNRLTELERIHSLIEERAKLVLDVEYAKRTVSAMHIWCNLQSNDAGSRWQLAVEQQKGNVNCIADRKQALENAQLECERATRFIAEQLKFVRPNQDTDVLELFQEYAQLVAQFFERGVDLVDGAQ